jgi:transposase-like protein
MNSKKRWTVSRKAELILSLLKGQKQLVDICREYDLKQSEVEKWQHDFLQGGEKNLKTVKLESNEKDCEIKELREKVGELTLELDATKKLSALIALKKKTS